MGKWLRSQSVFKVHSTSSKYCITCFIEKDRPIIERLFIEDPLCYQCRQALLVKRQSVVMDHLKIEGWYIYEDVVRTYVILYKEAFDVLLHKIFTPPIRFRLWLFYSDYYVVYVPSTKGALERRGYDHMKLISQELGLPIIEGVLLKRDAPKQSTLSVSQRAEVSQYFHVERLEKIKDKKLILIDDVVTTGASIRACYELLRPHCKRIKTIGLCIHPKLLLP